MKDACFFDKRNSITKIPCGPTLKPHSTTETYVCSERGLQVV